MPPNRSIMIKLIAEKNKKVQDAFLVEEKPETLVEEIKTVQNMPNDIGPAVQDDVSEAFLDQTSKKKALPVKSKTT